MKTTFKFIIAAMAASAVLSSCTKEMALENTAGSTGEVRVISASFSAPTKSTLDGKTPKFVGGEEIMVSNENRNEKCVIAINDQTGDAYFQTSLGGNLTAVYPYAAASMDGQKIDQSKVLVPTVQDGTFASANIAMAIDFGNDGAIFYNKTAVIKITPGAGAETKYVEVITAGAEIANQTSAGFEKLNKIRVTPTANPGNPVYVSILVPTGLKVGDLSFADGSNIKTSKGNSTTIAINTISSVSASDWDKPYVEIGGVKWATMNLGANAVTDCGNYFAWGETVGHAATAGDVTKAFENAFTGNTDGFVWKNDPSNNGNTEFSQTAFSEWAPGKVLSDKLTDLADAVRQNDSWGGDDTPWRMPTNEDFAALCKAGFIEWTNSYNDSGVAGLIVWVPQSREDEGWYKPSTYSEDNKKCQKFNGSKYGDLEEHQPAYQYNLTINSHVFFPAAGYGNGTELRFKETRGYYLSSNLYYFEGKPTYANFFNFKVASPGSTEEYIHSCSAHERRYGRSVRPVMD